MSVPQPWTGLNLSTRLSATPTSSRSYQAVIILARTRPFPIKNTRRKKL